MSHCVGIYLPLLELFSKTLHVCGVLQTDATILTKECVQSTCSPPLKRNVCFRAVTVRLRESGEHGYNPSTRKGEEDHVEDQPELHIQSKIPPQRVW